MDDLTILMLIPSQIEFGTYGIMNRSAILEKRVGTLDPLYFNYPSARDCKDIWGNALF